MYYFHNQRENKIDFLTKKQTKCLENKKNKCVHTPRSLLACSLGPGRNQLRPRNSISHSPDYSLGFSLRCSRLPRGTLADGRPFFGQGSPVHPLEKSTAATSPLPASVTVLNQSSSFSKQVSSATGCLGSTRTAQRAGRSWEHSGSMAKPGIRPRPGGYQLAAGRGAKPQPGWGGGDRGGRAGSTV